MGTNCSQATLKLASTILWIHVCRFCADLRSTKSLKYAVLRLELLFEEIKLLLHSHVRTSWHVGRGLG